ncbi:hypothetical protein [Aggregatibacter actinomycetemcomitans]|nr:hypothetical protein [Aggregatibacter actinomycetemcomitans]
MNIHHIIISILIARQTGNTVFESQSKEAKAEINQITNEILTALGVQYE